MPKNKSVQSGESSSAPSHPLADRVRARVTEVRIALDQRASASRPRAKRTGTSPAAPDEVANSRVPAAARAEASSLRRVFNEMAVIHRQHRLRTGQHASAALREAASVFKQAPSMPSLVVVAAFLEEDGLLEW